MNWIHTLSYESLSDQAATLFADVIFANPHAHIVLATGASPTGLYKKVSHMVPPSLMITKLDEWVGLPANHPGACETYLEEHVLSKWKVDRSRYLSFDPLTQDPDRECRSVRDRLARGPRIDLCVLGIGVEGHLGLNEAGPVLQSDVHVAQLAETTRRHSMFEGEKDPPTHGMTLGMGNLLQSDQILLLISGKTKRPIQDKLMSGDITTEIPASMLHLHPRVTVITDQPMI